MGIFGLPFTQIILPAVLLATLLSAFARFWWKFSRGETAVLFLSIVALSVGGLSLLFAPPPTTP